MDRVQQIAVHTLPGLNPAKLVQNSGQFVPESLIDPGVALDYDLLFQQPPGDVVLFRQAGQLDAENPMSMRSETAL